MTMTERDVKEPMSPVPSTVLLVEDNVIVALDTEETLKRLGVSVVITASSVSQALAAIERQAPEFALLDVNLGPETGFAIAERLAGLKIPFVFATGYGEQFAVPAVFADAPKIGKPYSVDTLRTMLGLAEF
jgi:CheY-like chemotaxis protein